eukprot:TRINITY_DN25816_c1_g2_i1.p1 TRINITY_DN25816_c1_g2~~TRINITY_DN25816_c1_g2_i1.p1  ORF type:complete len:252 (+),score=53.69 TRINITY_DN25816_c1_g2_i1:64-819(+)
MAQGTERMIDVAEIRFTQEHVYDSFNANDERAMNVVDLINAILRGEKTPRDLPLIRVAAKKGAYWCVDNRRLFVYKHCQLGEIPVQVFAWKDNREFELKYKNGLRTRAQTNGGRRVGVIQRTSVRFPWSAVMEPSLSTISKYMTSDEQQRHDEAIAELKRPAAKRETSSVATALRDVLSASLDDQAPAAKRRKKGKLKKKSGGGSRDDATGKDASAKAVAVEGAGASSLTVTLAAEDSDDEDYAVEVFAPP